MDNKKDDFYHVHKIITDLEFLISHTKALSREEFEKTKYYLTQSCSDLFKFQSTSRN